MSVYIKIDGLADREVVTLHYDLHQETDVEGRPSAITRGGTITVTTKSLNDGNSDLFEWACDPYISKNGKVEFEKRDGTNMKTLEFEDAYLIQYAETYNALDANAQMENFTVSAKKISIAGVFHENPWADK
ncbi:MAG: type VI secretion system tube protein TssD [Bacteroidales bacterium]|jgi:hypothetical protein